MRSRVPLPKQHTATEGSSPELSPAGIPLSGTMTCAHSRHWLPPGLLANIALLGVVVLLNASRAYAQRPWILEIDNDALNPTVAGSPTDAEYTHGMRLRIPHGNGSPVGRWLFPSRPGCEAVAGSGPCQDWSLVLGQEIYTPEITRREAAAGDRAYAGWLGASMQVHLHQPGVEHGIALTIGVTGAPSLAAPAQRAVHHLIGSPPPAGWSDQLGTEPTLDLRYDGSIDVFHLHTGPSLGARITPVWGASLGTVHREAALGVEAALELGAPGVSRWRQSGAGHSPSGIYAVGLVRTRVVAGNLFLDGGFLRSGRAVGHLPIVAVLEFGAGLRTHGVGLEWRVVSGSREYAAQATPHAYTTIALLL